MTTFKNITNEILIKSILDATYLNQILKSLNIIDNTHNRNKLKNFIKENNIDISHIKSPTTKSKYNTNPKKCKFCGKIIPYEKRANDFCNHSCSASYNNIGIIRNGKALPEHSYCLNCGKEINRGNKYCNNTCRSEYKRKEYIKRWQAGKESGIIGKDDISTIIKIYLREKYHNSCQCCGWNKINPYTGLVPLLIHHIDGNCLNNKESNLLLLCPNCHSLTENFGSRNKNCSRVDKRLR